MATFEETARLILQCCRFFERKEPSPATLELWHEDLKDLDAVYFPQVVYRFGKIDGWPRNYPVKIREIYGIIVKSGKGWTTKELVGLYYRDHMQEINEEATSKGIDPSVLAWAEMSQALVRKGDISVNKAKNYWNMAKKGPLPDYLRKFDNNEDEIIGKFKNGFCSANEIPF